jgi:DNA-binding PadR family transcriptional regulator
MDKWNFGKSGWGFDPGAFFNQGRKEGKRSGRVFEQGDLKYVILQLLDEKPRHGYEIIKEIEDRFGGSYSPSPGVVYPTLTMLEDMGFAKATVQESGKKIYEITAEGKAHLASNRPIIDDIFSRISEMAQSIFGEPMMDVHKAFKNLGAAVYAPSDRKRTPEQIKKIQEILDRATMEIRGV